MADYLADDTSDMQVMPIAMHCPQLLCLVVPAMHIPGHSSFQVEASSFEHATLWQRVKSEWILVKLCRPSSVSSDAGAEETTKGASMTHAQMKL